MESMFIDVAGRGFYKCLFLGIMWNFQNILSEVQLWTTASKSSLLRFFLKVFTYSSFLPNETILLVIWQKLKFENMPLKNNQFSKKELPERQKFSWY